MKKRAKLIYIIVSVVLCSLLMSVIDGVVNPAYHIKSIIKLIAFLSVPAAYLLIFGDEREKLKALFIPTKKGIFISALLGVGVFSVIIGGYFLLRGVLDFSGIASDLTSDAGVSADNFLWVSIYIALVNSLLEELFFRGFAFGFLKDKLGNLGACVFSSALFALYHVGMTGGWFNIPMALLMMLGLFVGGCIFSMLNDRLSNIYGSYFVHMSANLAINSIGFMLFGMI